MGQDKTKLMHLFNFVKDIYNDPDNKDFAVWVQSLVLNGNNIPQDINEIRKALGLRGKQSIDYSFVKNETVRLQLIVDNLRMENARLNLTMSDVERETSFCINAHLQVEGLLNYYYMTKHNNNIKAIIQDIKDSTKTTGFTSKKNGQFVSTAYNPSNESDIKNVESIFIKTKSMAFVEGYQLTHPGTDLMKMQKVLDYIREQRNDSFHRGTTAIEIGTNWHYDMSYIKKNLSSLIQLVKEELS